MSIATHPIAPEEIMALLDDELCAGRAEFVAAHLEQCVRCGNMAESLRSGSQALATWTVPAAPIHAPLDGLGESTGANAPEPGSLGSIRIGGFLRRHGPVTACAAALAVTILVGAQWSVLHAPKGAMRFSNWGSVSTGHGLPAERPTGTRKALLERSPAPPASRAQTSGRNAESIDGMLDENGLLSPEDRFSRPEFLQPPMIARSVSLSIVAKDFAASRASLDAILVRHHGYTASLTANAQPNAARSLEASLRIPATELNAALAELKSFGQVQNETQNGEEVTAQHADLAARLKNSRETERRLQAILEQRTGKVSDVLAVEQEIARVRGEIEGMEAEQKSLEHRVSFATIELRLAEEYKAQITQPSPAISTRIHNSVVAGYRDAVESLVRIVLAFAACGPTLLIWLAFLAPVVWFVRRRWLRASALEASPSA
jgi:DNA-binding phage protein